MTSLTRPSASWSASTATVLPSSVPSSSKRLTSVCAWLSLRGVGREQQRRWRLVDPRLLELVTDVDRLVVARQAELRVAREVDEHPEHGEHLLVLGERGAEGQRAGLLAGDRLVGLEDRLDLAAADATVLVDVVDEDLRGLLLVAAVEVDEVA